MKSYWIWNYGDYEIYHSNLANSRRQAYKADYPVFWRLYDVDRNVKFYYDLNTEKDGYLEFFVNGIGNIFVDEKIYPHKTKIKIEKGSHTLKISVTNLTGLPAVYIKSDLAPSNDKWYTLTPDMEKIPVGYDTYYDSESKNPEIFPFEYERVLPKNITKENDGILYEFEKELFGFLYINNVSKTDKISVSYGESKEEALDSDFSIVSEDITGSESYKLRQRAFRYIFIKGCTNPEVYADYEYLPLEYKGSFKCDNEDINKIRDMCAYTLHLTTREVQLEAIKRDRWLWGGDAYQAYKFSNYLFFDKEIIRRSTIALRGKEPFCEHINTITDYSFYWVIGLMEYYENYKDIDFIRFIYPRAVTLMDFSSKRVNKDGFITGIDNDWIFIDWSDIDKDGAVCAEQMLYIKANRVMAELCEILGKDGTKYTKIADNFTKRVNEFFWNDEKGAFIDTYESGKNHVTRHANIFAVMYDIATKEQVKSIKENVLLNDNITKITTPYFEGYELDVFGKLEQYDYIENKINSYWKGMLDLGATTVWEEFNPELSGTQHYEMYGDKYGKSLCHAWGAAPIYLLGKYFLGVYPTTAGFDTFEVKPHLGNFKYISGTVPVKDGEVRVYLSKEKLKVTATKNGGTLLWQNKKYPLKANEEFSLEL